MSIRDYNQKYVLINGTTSEKIVIPKTTNNKIITTDININDYLMLQEILGELNDTESVTIFKSYMKD